MVKLAKDLIMRVLLALLFFHRISQLDLQIGKTENVLNLVKQTEKEMKPYKITTSKKAGKTFLSADDERLLMDLQPYYNRDIDSKSDLWFDGITHEDFFKKLANRYGKSLSDIKKFSQRHDPNNQLH